MYVLKLYHQLEPMRLISSRQLESGALTIGRDSTAGWAITDPYREISRIHCVVTATATGLTVRDQSSNGLTLGPQGDRVQKGAEVRLSRGDQLHLGPFIIVIEEGANALPATGSDDFSPRPDSPFAPPPGVPSHLGFSAPAPVNPFRAASAGEPLRSAGDAGGSVRDHDAWDAAPQRRAGDWETPSPSESREIGAMIGSDHYWTDPQPQPLPDVGFGFDAPFSRPLLQAAPVPKEALAIPSNWDAEDLVPATPTPPPTPFDAAPAAPMARTPEPPLFPGRQDVDEPARDRLTSELPPAVPAPRSPPTSAPLLASPLAPADDLTLFHAFCEGADLNPSDFSGQDPRQVMRAAGAAYQQMVLGLSDLMSERTSLKNEFRMVRTTVRPENNNPFKWAPPRRVAVDLLRSNSDGFVDGPTAVRESFSDLKKHLLCLLSGMRASLAATLDALNPDRVEGQIKSGPLGLLSNRAAAAWQEYRQLFTTFKGEADHSADSPLNQEFRTAYERQLKELDELSSLR